MSRLLIEKFFALVYRPTGLEVGNISDDGLNQPHKHHGEPERYGSQKPGQTDTQAMGDRPELNLYQNSLKGPPKGENSQHNGSQIAKDHDYGPGTFADDGQY